MESCVLVTRKEVMLGKVIFTILKWKGGISCTAVDTEHGKKVVGRVLEKRLHRIVSVIMKRNLVLFQRMEHLMF